MAAIPLMLTGAMPQAFSSLAGAQQAQPTAAPAAAPTPTPAPTPPAPTMTPASMTSTTQGSNPFFQNPPLAGGANVASVNNPNSNFLLALLQQLFHGGNAFGALGANTMGQGAAAAATQAPAPSALGIGGGGAATFAPGSGNALGALPPPSTFAGASNPFTAAAAAPVQSAQSQTLAAAAQMQQAEQQIQSQLQIAQAAARQPTTSIPGIGAFPTVDLAAGDPFSNVPFSAASIGGA